MSLGSASPPVLTTERLELRAHTVADFEDSLRLWSDAEVVRFIGGRPSSETEVWARLLRYGGLWSLLGLGYWVARTRAEGRFVGELGLSRFRRGLGPDFDQDVEAGWALTPEAQGRGLAREALTAALAWADRGADARADAGRIVCMISPENAASIRLAERLGFRAFADREAAGGPTRLFERLRPPEAG